MAGKWITAACGIRLGVQRAKSALRDLDPQRLARFEERIEPAAQPEGKWGQSNFSGCTLEPGAWLIALRCSKGGLTPFSTTAHYRGNLRAWHWPIRN